MIVLMRESRLSPGSSKARSSRCGLSFCPLPRLHAAEVALRTTSTASSPGAARQRCSRRTCMARRASFVPGICRSLLSDSCFGHSVGEWVLGGEEPWTLTRRSLIWSPPRCLHAQVTEILAEALGVVVSADLAREPKARDQFLDRPAIIKRPLPGVPARARRVGGCLDRPSLKVTADAECHPWGARAGW